jgi:hypothetical protein
MSKSRNFCFTFNNYTEDDINHLNLVVCQYIVFGKEVGENGTPHLQGFVKFATPRTFASVKKTLCRPGESCHIEAAKNVAASVQYCRKDNDYSERGELSAGQGNRTDLDDFKNWVKANDNVNLLQARELFSEICAKFPQFVDYYISDNREKPKVDIFPLRKWQADLNNYLKLPGVDREIIFVVDEIGNTGKSWFCKYFDHLHDNVQIMSPCKKVDMAYMLDESARVIFMDCPRSLQEFLSYSLLEELKNGRVTSSKYMSRVKLFGLIHLVVMTNQYPDMTKLSIDRYKIIRITSENNATE